MSFYGPLTGQQYESAEARDHYERMASQRLASEQTPDPLDPNYVGPTAEDIKKAHELAIAAQRDDATRIADEAASKVFLELNPWFVACQPNATQMEEYFTARGRTLNQSVSVEQLEEAAGYLADRGLLKINAEALAAERKGEVKQMADEIRQARRSSSGISTRSGVSTRTVSRSVRPTYSEDDLYSMDMDQLRAIALRESGEDQSW